MKDRIEQKLKEKYPNLYKHLEYIECGDGWYNLLDQLSKNLEPLACPDLYACQVKEKFGTLRFYLEGEDAGNKEAQMWITKAEQLSAEVCEYCSAPGELDKTHGWLKTKCKDCK